MNNPIIDIEIFGDKEIIQYIRFLRKRWIKNVRFPASLGFSGWYMSKLRSFLHSGEMDPISDFTAKFKKMGGAKNQKTFWDIDYWALRERVLNRSNFRWMSEFIKRDVANDGKVAFSFENKNPEKKSVFEKAKWITEGQSFRVTDKMRRHFLGTVYARDINKRDPIKKTGEERWRLTEHEKRYSMHYKGSFKIYSDRYKWIKPYATLRKDKTSIEIKQRLFTQTVYNRNKENFGNMYEKSLASALQKLENGYFGVKKPVVSSSENSGNLS